uniref:Galactose oxidase n=1 Tax=Peronospora matthiolae TaxID=2874970 RepID=A0AAV1TIM1_9STRA
MAILSITTAEKDVQTLVCETTATASASTSLSRLEVRAWEKLQPHGDVYSPRTGHTVSSKDNRVYVFGGTDRRRRQQDLYQLDLASSTWSQVQTRGLLPPRRSGALGVVHQSDMFIFGGYDGRDGNYFNDLYYFNFDDERWRQMPSAVADRPEARTDHIMVLHASSIYIFGGYNGSARFNDLCGYDLHAQRWNRLQPLGLMPSRRFGHSGVVHAETNRLLVFGGWDGRDTLNDLHEYSFITNEWRQVETKGSSPPHRYRHTAVIYGNNMFVFGGVDKTHSRFNDLQCLDLLTNTWSEVCTAGSIPSSRTFHRAVVVGSKMYLLGGYDGTDRLQDLYSIDIGALTPPSLLEICADYVRANLDVVLETTTFKGVPQDLIDHVVFKRDMEGRLRGKCKLCRPGRCCVYRMQTIESCPQDDPELTRTNRSGCVCGHSTFHHEVVEESKLYGKKPTGSTSTKVMMLCGSIYKRFFDTASSALPTSSLLSSPRSGYSDDSTTHEKECFASAT